MDLSFLIVNWNVRDLLRRALLSIQTFTPPELNCEVLVVDNASSDGSVDMLRAEFPQVQVISNTENAGFTRGNNQVLAAARGRYLFLLNPDAELTPGAVGALYAYAETNPQAGILGPELRYGDGSLQSSRRRFPTFLTALLESTRLQQTFPRNRWLERYFMHDTPEDATQPVDWVVGAAMFVRREVYIQVGGFDEGFFMYSEELDWCRRARQAGWQVVYFPAARVTHHEGKSSEQARAARDIYFHSSKVRYFRKHHGLLAAESLRLFLLGMFGFQCVEEGAKWVLGHKRPLRAARLRAYTQVLRSGLRQTGLYPLTEGPLLPDA